MKRWGKPVNVTWLEMPVAYSGDTGRSVYPKYAINDSAVVLYKKDRAYVGLAMGEVITALLAHDDVRAVPEAELESLQESFWASRSGVEDVLKRTGSLNHRIERAATRIGLGDTVAAVTRRLGIRECHGCARRHGALNRWTIRRWWPRASHAVPHVRQR
jgi:hypothetical protein